MHIGKGAEQKSPAMSCEVEERFFVQTLITFKVGEKLFKVPQTGFESSFLVDHIQSRNQSPSESESCSSSSCEADSNGSGNKEIASHFIELKNINPDEFYSFLKILIPTPLGVKETVTEADFQSALKLATKFGGFDAVRDACITGLENLDISSAQKISLAQEHNVPQWLAPEIFNLAIRIESLTADECRLLGVETMAQVASLRDKRYEMLSKLSEPAACNAALADAGIFAMDELIGERKKYAEEPSPESDVLNKMVETRDEVSIALKELTEEREAINQSRERAIAQALLHEEEEVFQAYNAKIEEANARVIASRAVLSTFFKSQDEQTVVEQWMRTLIGAEGEYQAYKKEVADAREGLEETRVNDDGEQNVPQDQAPEDSNDSDNVEQKPNVDGAGQNQRAPDSNGTSEKEKTASASESESDVASDVDSCSTTAKAAVPDRPAAE